MESRLSISKVMDARWDSKRNILAVIDKGIRLFICDNYLNPVLDMKIQVPPRVYMDLHPVKDQIIVCEEINSRFRLACYNTLTAQLEFVLKEYQGWIRPIFSPSGNKLVVFSDNIDLWDFAKGNVIQMVPRGSISEIFWSLDEQYFVAVGYHGFINIFDANDGALLKEIIISDKFPYPAYSPLDHVIVYCKQDKTQYQYDIHSDTTIPLILGETEASVGFSPNGKLMYAYYPDGKVNIFDATNKNKLDTIEEFEEILDIIWHPNSEVVAIFQRRLIDRMQEGNYISLPRIHIYSLQSHTFLHRINILAPTLALKWSYDGKLLLGFSEYFETYLWETENFTVLKFFEREKRK